MVSTCVPSVLSQVPMVCSGVDSESSKARAHYSGSLTGRSPALQAPGRSESPDSGSEPRGRV
jgi:hypothetical protein